MSINSNKQDKSKAQGWNTQDLIKMSRSLGEAFLPGLDNSKFNEETDSLTMDKFVEMNKNRSKNKLDA